MLVLCGKVNICVLELVMQAFCCTSYGTAKCASKKADPVSAWLCIERLDCPPADAGVKQHAGRN